MTIKLADFDLEWFIQLTQLAPRQLGIHSLKDVPYNLGQIEK